MPTFKLSLEVEFEAYDKKDADHLSELMCDRLDNVTPSSTNITKYDVETTHTGVDDA